MADQVLPGYPVPHGGRQEWVLQHAGPALYATGGETFDIAHLNGGGVIDYIEAAGLSFNSATSGTYYVKAFYPIGQGVAGASGSVNVVLKWYNVSDNNEVTSQTVLTAEFIRLRVIGG
jgi:hypothetical protein